jgi:hypothetical protein
MSELQLAGANVPRLMKRLGLKERVSDLRRICVDAADDAFDEVITGPLGSGREGEPVNWDHELHSIL